MPEQSPQNSPTPAPSSAPAAPATITQSSAPTAPARIDTSAPVQTGSFKPSLVNSAPRNNRQQTEDSGPTIQDVDPLEGDLVDKDGTSFTPELKLNPPPTQQKSPIGKTQKVSRDFTGIPDELQPLMKAMSNEAFETFKTKIPVWLEAETKAARVAELEAKLAETSESKGPKFFYDHPEAFRLSPEFSQLETEFKQLETEETFWKQQLLSGRQTKKFRMPQGIDEKGNIVLYPQEYDLTPEAELELQNCYNLAQQKRNELTQKRTGLQQNFQAQYKSAISAVDATCDQHFPWRKAQPELLNQAYEIPGLGKRTVKQMREDAMTLLPAQLRNHPTTSVIQDLFAAVNILKSYVGELTEKAKVSQAKTTEQAQLLPKATRASASQATSERVLTDDVNEFR